MVLQKATKILDKLKRHRFVTPFLLPVDPIALNIPDYFNIIKEPMDISTVEKNLRNHIYSAYEEFERDVRKIWENALTYNPQQSNIHQMTLEIKQYFENINNDIKYSDSVKGSRDRLSGNDRKSTSYNPKANFAQNKYNRSTGFKTGNNDQPLTYQEKKNLSDMIRSLGTEHLLGVWEIVSEGNDQLKDNQIEFDIETLPVRKARELERYVQSKFYLVMGQNNNDSLVPMSPSVPNPQTVQEEEVKEKEAGPLVDNSENQVKEVGSQIENYNQKVQYLEDGNFS